ncbi:hypothetical protein EDC01DRAFT_787559 [Geopyxis carbonaria]|nr:hypothetical protein EDC01DRAFT_787559 [Geopyxis carbonaria]
MSLRGSSSAKEDPEVLLLRQVVEELRLQNELLSRRVKLDEPTYSRSQSAQQGAIGMEAEENVELLAEVSTPGQKDLPEPVFYNDRLTTQLRYPGAITGSPPAGKKEETPNTPKMANDSAGSTGAQTSNTISKETTVPNHDSTHPQTFIKMGDSWTQRMMDRIVNSVTAAEPEYPVEYGEPQSVQVAKEEVAPTKPQIKLGHDEARFVLVTEPNPEEVKFKAREEAQKKKIEKSLDKSTQPEPKKKMEKPAENFPQPTKKAERKNTEATPAAQPLPLFGERERMPYAQTNVTTRRTERPPTVADILENSKNDEKKPAVTSLKGLYGHAKEFAPRRPPPPKYPMKKEPVPVPNKDIPAGKVFTNSTPSQATPAKYTESVNFEKRATFLTPTPEPEPESEEPTTRRPKIRETRSQTRVPPPPERSRRASPSRVDVPKPTRAEDRSTRDIPAEFAPPEKKDLNGIRPGRWDKAKGTSSLISGLRLDTVFEISSVGNGIAATKGKKGVKNPRSAREAKMDEEKEHRSGKGKFSTQVPTKKPSEDPHTGYFHRSVQILNLPPNVSLEELMLHIRGGAVDLIQIDNCNREAYVVFVEEDSAQLYYDFLLATEVKIEEYRLKPSKLIKPIQGARVFGAGKCYHEGLSRHVWMGGIDPPATFDEIWNLVCRMRDGRPIEMEFLESYGSSARFGFPSIADAQMFVQYGPTQSRFRGSECYYENDPCDAPCKEILEHPDLMYRRLLRQSFVAVQQAAAEGDPNARYYAIDLEGVPICDSHGIVKDQYGLPISEEELDGDKGLQFRTEDEVGDTESEAEAEVEAEPEPEQVDGYTFDYSRYYNGNLGKFPGYAETERGHVNASEKGDSVYDGIRISREDNVSVAGSRYQQDRVYAGEPVYQSDNYQQDRVYGSAKGSVHGKRSSVPGGSYAPDRVSDNISASGSRYQQDRVYAPVSEYHDEMYEQDRVYAPEEGVPDNSSHHSYANTKNSTYDARRYREDDRGYPEDDREYPEDDRGYPEDDRGYPENDLLVHF